MKLLYSFILVFLFTDILFSQGEGGGETFPENELNIQIQNITPEGSITFEFIPIGANWARNTGCNFLLYNDQTTYISTVKANSSGYNDCWYNGYEYRFYWEGNSTSISNCADSTAGLKPLRNGLYRINIKENNQLKTYAYFDWRDIGFTQSSPTCNYCPGLNDMTIRYDGNTQKLMFWNNNSIHIPNQDPQLELNAGDLITWSEWKCSTPTTSSFEDFWENDK